MQPKPIAGEQPTEISQLAPLRFASPQDIWGVEKTQTISGLAYSSKNMGRVKIPGRFLRKFGQRPLRQRRDIQRDLAFFLGGQDMGVKRGKKGQSRCCIGAQLRVILTNAA